MTAGGRVRAPSWQDACAPEKEDASRREEAAVMHKITAHAVDDVWGSGYACAQLAVHGGASLCCARHLLNFL